MAFTKVVGAGIHTLSNIASHNINSSGIITATKFVGPIEGNITAVDGVFSGNLTVQGTTTTLDTNLIDVDKIEVTTESTNVAVAVTHNGSGDLVRLNDGSSQVVTVDDEGNVTLSKNNPTITLSDTNNNPDYQIGNINGVLRFQDTTNNATRIGVGTDGNVGIGTDNPANPLDLYQTNGRQRFNKYGHYIAKNNSASTTQYWTFAPRNSGGLGIGRGVPDVEGTVSAVVDKLTITSDGKILIGDDTAEATMGLIANIQTFGTDAGKSSIAIRRGSNDAQAAFLVMSKSRNTSVGSRTILQNGDEVGNIFFVADDGTDLASNTAAIKSQIDGAPGANVTPGNLTFWTTADNANSATERLRITSSGNVGVGIYADPQDLLTLRSANNDTSIRIIDPSNNNYGAHFSFYNNENELRIGGIENTVKRAAIRINRDADDNAICIDTIARVGIGSTTPTQKLDVDGTVKATSFIGALTGTASGNPVLAGSTNNQLVTVTGANALTGESGLTYNSSTFSVTGNIDLTNELNFNGNNNKFIDFETIDNNKRFDLRHRNASSHETAISCIANGAVKLFYNGGTTAKLETTNDGILVPSGIVEINRGSASDVALVVNTTSTTNACRIAFNESSTRKAEIAYSHDNDRIEVIGKSGQGASIFTDNLERFHITSTGNVQLPTNGQQLTWGASQQMKFYYENSEDRMYLQGDGAYGFAIRVNSGNRLEISKTTGDVVMQGASGRNFQWDNSEASLYLTDSGSGSSARLKVGSGGDLQLYHDVSGANHITCATNRELKLSANKHTFYDYTGVTKRMEIDANGYVTKPKHPSFLAGRTGGNQTFTVGTFPLNETRINVGNHYDTSTYKFTAPVAGVYYFHAQVYYNNGSGAYRVGFRKTPNGGSAFMLNTASHEVVGNDDQQSTSIIESMAVGDTVELFCDSNVSIQCYYNINDTTYGAHTYFMGYLIG